MLVSILLCPLIAAFCSGFLGRFLGRRGVVLVTLGCMFISFACSIYLFAFVGLQFNSLHFNDFSWIRSSELTIEWSFIIDALTSTMLLVVTSVSLLVHWFSSEYMEKDSHLPRFLSYLSFFTFFMLFFICSNDLVQMFFGWEGVGICSYLLINFWYNRVQANKAALKAVAVNKIGDLAFLFGILLVFLFIRTTDLNVVLLVLPSLTSSFLVLWGYSVTPTTLINFLFVLAAIGKSAQVGLHTWLPDAMEGPTPVSALIHAATMVTAGVLLILRISPLLIAGDPVVLLLITFIGSLTAFIFSFVGMFQYDIKKIIAYSTCSQLGYMFFICGTSNFNLGFFHVFTHAGFKALLFLTAGALIHSLGDEQDIRRFGGLLPYYPLYCALFCLASLSLAGFPFLAGFYSKDLILEVLQVHFVYKSSFSALLGQAGALLSAVYSIRFIQLSFFGTYRGTSLLKEQVHEPSFSFLFIFFLLIVFSTFNGYFFHDIFYGGGSYFHLDSYETSLSVVYENELVPFWLKQLPLALSLLGLILFISHTSLSPSMEISKYKYQRFFLEKGGFDFLYNTYIALPLYYVAYSVAFKALDKYVFEVFGPYGFSKLAATAASLGDQLQSGLLKHYLIVFMLILNFIVFLC